MVNPAIPPDPTNPYDPRNDPIQGRRYGGVPFAGLANVVLLIFILVNSVLAGAAAIVGGPVLVGLTKLVDWNRRLRFGEAWGASFLGFFAYFMISSLLSTTRGRVTPPDDFFSGAMLLHLVQEHGLPLLACTAVIMWRVKAPYRGFFGFFRALAASGVSLLIGAALPALLVFRLAHVSETPEGLADGLLGLSAVILVFALVGAIAASVPLWLGARLGPRLASPPGWGRIYLTAALLLAVWAVASVAFEFLFMALDPLYEQFQAYRAAADPAAYLATAGIQLQVPLTVFITEQLVAMGLAAGVVLSRLAPAFPGRGGWLRSLVTTGAAIVASWLMFAAAGVWLYGMGAFDDVAAYW
jgi:hypothetical protein